MAETDYRMDNNLYMRGNHIRDWRGDFLTEAEIQAIPLATDADKQAQEGRKIYNSTTKHFMRYDIIENAFVEDGANGEGFDRRRGKLDWSVETETTSVKKNPPALDACSAGDYWVVAKSGSYTYIDKDGNTITQKADIGSTFNVIAVVVDDEEVLDWQYTESETSQLEFIIQYNADAPDLTTWTFTSYTETEGVTIYDLWKNGYNINVFRETTETGAVSGGQIVKRMGTLDCAMLVKDADTYAGKEVYKLVVDFAHPLVEGDKYIVVVK